MSQHRPVPRLDLAPKLRRPLSLWNPLDYLRLLYWVFFFPQALRWYLDTFVDGFSPSWERWKLQRRLALQGFVLAVAMLLALGVMSQVLVYQRSLLLKALGAILGVALLTTLIVALVVGLSKVLSKTWSKAWEASSLRLIVALTAVSSAALGWWFPSTSGLVVIITLGVGITIGIFRPESWLLGLLLAIPSLPNGSWLLPRITPLPLPYLAFRLQNWLQQDWETSLHNTNQLLEYTLQFSPVVQAVNKVLAKTPSEQLIWRVSRLAEAHFDWQLVRFASASLDASLKSTVVKAFFSWFFFFPRRWQEQLQAGLVTETRLDTPARAAAAGFWHLYIEEPAKAMEAFAVVRSLLYGEEMFTLAQTLAVFHDAKELATIAALEVPACPKEPLLRPVTWKMIASLHRVVEDVQVVERSVSHSARAFALNRASGELIKILNNSDTVSETERGLILDVVSTWAEALLQVAGEVGEISITKPVTNPYVVGNPVEGNLFVGREDVLRQLEELWVMGHQLQSVVLYGHRRMGKTSILLNAAKCSGSEVKVAYVNLLGLGDCPQGVGEVLMAISDAISDAVGCTPPSDTDLLNLPYRTFERYLKQVQANLNGGLIIALDEFEKIEELIEAEKIPKDFMGFLRRLVQMSSKVAFAFAGLHTLEEMTADYFQPFFASVIPIHVGFLQPGATRQILANPDEDFPLDYTPEALDQIYALTAGQPYLVQLVGFQLVRRYNDYVFEQGRPRDPVFTVEDVEAVINDPEFFKRGRYYFDGVWGQAARGAFGQQGILKALAPYPDGLSIDALAQVTGMEEETLQEALKTLTRHDVVREREGCWQIIVELFRRWVLQS